MKPISFLLSKLNKYKKSFILYVFVGGICALINWAFFYILITYMGIGPILAATLAFIVSCSVNFVLSRKMFPSSGRRKREEFLLIFIVSSIALGIDLSTMSCLLKFFHISPMPAKILGTGTSFLFNYSTRQFYIFRQK